MIYTLYIAFFIHIFISLNLFDNFVYLFIFFLLILLKFIGFDIENKLSVSEVLKPV